MGLAGFEPTSSGLEPDVLPDYTIAPITKYNSSTNYKSYLQS